MAKKITTEDIMLYDNVPVSVAAAYLGKTVVSLQCALKSQRCPFGYAVLMDGGKWSYSISPGMLTAYKNGTMIVHIRNTGELLGGVVMNAR